jgi:hypothetical protein
VTGSCQTGTQHLKRTMLIIADVVVISAACSTKNSAAFIQSMDLSPLSTTCDARFLSLRLHSLLTTCKKVYNGGLDRRNPDDLKPDIISCQVTKGKASVDLQKNSRFN